MFKELFTESKGKGPIIKSSKAAKISDIVKVIKDMKPMEIIKIYNDLSRGWLDEDVYDFTVQPGTYADYYNDRDKKGLLKSVLTNFKKAMKKVGIDSSVHDCAKNYIKNNDDKIDDFAYYINKKYSGKSGDLIPNIKSYKGAEDFVKEFNIVDEYNKALRRLPESLVCDIKNAGIDDVTVKRIPHNEVGLGHKTAWTEEYEITVKFFGLKETIKFNVENTEITVHQSYWN